MSSPTRSNNSSKLVYGSLLIAGACAFLCVAIVAQAQYNTFDSDSNSDSDGNRILTQAELGKLVRNSAKAQPRHNLNQQQQQQQFAAATRNLYNKQQPLQYAQSHNRRNYGSSNEAAGNYGNFGGPVMGSASHGRGSNSEPNDDDENDSASFGPNFNTNFDGGSSNVNDDDGEGRNSNDGAAMNLNQAASGYPGQGNGDYNGDSVGASGFGGFGDGPQGYGPSSSADGSDLGPLEGFGSGSGSGRRAKSASSLMGYRGGQEGDYVGGALQYGPSSAVNSGDGDGDGGSSYGPEGQGEGDDDD